MPEVRIDESVTPAAHRAGLTAALEARRVDNRFHYAGGAAAARWRALAAEHSPSRDDADGLVAYEAAARAVVSALADGPVHVIGVGCGDGVKERRLLGALAGTGRREIAATPIDVSVPLVTAAAEAMQAVPAVDATHAVAVDITTVRDLSPLLAPRLPGTRVVTLFGVLSTLGDGALAPAISLLDPGDILMASANLLPPSPDARDVVMAQYDNRPTREWLGTVLAEIGVGGADDIRFRWERSPTGDTVVGEVTPPAQVIASVSGVTVGLPAGMPIRVLESHRHSADGLSRMLAAAGLDVRATCVSPSAEEGVAVGVSRG